MSTAKRNEEIDEQEWMRSHPPPGRNWPGQEERRIRRLDALKTRLTIRLDAAVIEEFKRLSPDGKGYQNLIHQALRGWLAAQGVKELVQERMDALVGEGWSRSERLPGRRREPFVFDAQQENIHEPNRQRIRKAGGNNTPTDPTFGAVSSC